MEKNEMPQAEGKFGGDPSITFKTAAKPENVGLECEELVKGNGKVVERGDTLTVHYHGVVWGKEKPFDSSFSRRKPASFPIGIGTLIKGWDEALIGKTVGSRLLLVVPPEYGYGKRGVPQAGIGPGDVLVFVIDIISAKK